MKKTVFIFLLISLMFPVFCSWEYKTQNEFSIENKTKHPTTYYINGKFNDSNTDKFIMFVIEDGDFAKGYIRFCGSGNLQEGRFDSSIVVYETKRKKFTLNCICEIGCNNMFWCCTVPLNQEVTQKLISVFSKRKSVKIDVLHGKNQSQFYEFVVDNKDFKSDITCKNGIHKHEDEKIIKKPTCVNEGEKTFICSRCKKTISESIPKIAHNYCYDKVTKNPTCIEEGIKTYKCSYCKDIIEENIEKINHKYEVKTNGDHSYSCIYCNRMVEIGEAGPAGGYIFFDKGEYSEGWRYLEAAPEDLSGKYLKSKFAWGEIKNKQFLCKEEIGQGKENSEKMLNESSDCKIDNIFVKASNYEINGFDDWFVPSKDELEYIYKNLYLNKIGNLKSDYYWSSSNILSSNNSKKAWTLSFINGSFYFLSSLDKNCVRVIRSF